MPMHPHLRPSRHFRQVASLALAATAFVVLPSPATASDDPPFFLDFGHVDLAWSFSPGQGWGVLAEYDEVFPTAFIAPEDVIFVAKDLPFPQDGSRVNQRPADPAWEFVGVDEGEPFWILPAAASGDVTELGFNTYDVTGVSLADNVRIDFTDVEFFGEGNGFFTVYTGFPHLGSEVLHHSTTPGHPGNGFYTLGVDDHQHVNWTFSDRGLYRVTMQASALLNQGDESSRVFSDPEQILIAVGLRGFENWLLTHRIEPDEWSEDTPVGPDSLPPLLQYALGAEPAEDTRGLVEFDIRSFLGSDFAVLEMPRRTEADDVILRVETSTDLVEWNHGPGHTTTLDTPPERLAERASSSMEDAPRLFLRAAAERVPQAP